MSHFLDRLTYFRRDRETFADGHGLTTRENRDWEDAYRTRWAADKIVRTFEPHQVTWKNDGKGEYQRLAREALAEMVAVEPLAAMEPDRARVRGQAIAVRLSGDMARERERRAAEGDGAE